MFNVSELADITILLACLLITIYATNIYSFGPVTTVLCNVVKIVLVLFILLIFLAYPADNGSGGKTMKLRWNNNADRVVTVCDKCIGRNELNSGKTEKREY